MKKDMVFLDVKDAEKVFAKFIEIGYSIENKELMNEHFLLDEGKVSEDVFFTICEGSIKKEMDYSDVELLNIVEYTGNFKDKDELSELDEFIKTYENEFVELFYSRLPEQELTLTIVVDKVSGSGYFIAFRDEVYEEFRRILNVLAEENKEVINKDIETRKHESLLNTVQKCMEIAIDYSERLEKEYYRYLK